MIRLEKITKKYADQKVLESITYHFPQKERIALVGANGQGKTTLLNVITGQDEADNGQIIQPKNARVAFLPQSFSETPLATILSECMSGHQVIYTYKTQMEDSLKADFAAGSPGGTERTSQSDDGTLFKFNTSYCRL